MNKLQFLRLYEEFDLFIRSLHGLYSDSLTGYGLISRYVADRQSNIAELLRGYPEADLSFQDTCHLPHSQIVQPSSASPSLYVPTEAEFKSRNTKGGENTWRLGNYCVLIAYTYWECYLRREVALALEVLDSNESDSEKIKEILRTRVSSDFWGNMAYFRHSILHCNGKASFENSACKIFKWFEPNAPIQIDERMMRAIFLAMIDYRNELHSKSLADDSFPITSNLDV